MNALLSKCLIIQLINCAPRVTCISIIAVYRNSWIRRLNPNTMDKGPRHNNSARGICLCGIWPRGRQNRTRSFTDHQSNISSGAVEALSWCCSSCQRDSCCAWSAFGPKWEPGEDNVSWGTDPRTRSCSRSLWVMSWSSTLGSHVCRDWRSGWLNCSVTKVSEFVFFRLS